MVKINTTFIIAILSMGITIVCFAVLLKFLIPPIVSKESIMVVLAMILMLNVEYIILLKSYELDMLYAARINRVKSDFKSEKDMVESIKKVWLGSRKKISNEEINEEIQRSRKERVAAISPGIDDEQFKLHISTQPLYNGDSSAVITTIDEPILQEEPDIPPEITVHDITDNTPRSMTDIIKEAENQLIKTLENKPKEQIEVYSEPVSIPIVYGDQPIPVEPTPVEPKIIEKPKPKTVTKRKAILRKKR